MKPVAFYDTECYPNYWLLKFRMTGYAEWGMSYSLQAGESLRPEDVIGIRTIFNNHTCVSFNGNYYDVPMITAALNGYTCEQLKELNDRIIPPSGAVDERGHKLAGLKPWELGLPEWKPSDHIDIMEVAPGMGSQKIYAGRIHCKTMRDLPYSPEFTLTPEEMQQVSDYCGNDLAVLEALYNALAPQLQQREELSKRYGIDLRSKSDAQLAEAVLKSRCEKQLGRRIYKSDPSTFRPFKYEPPHWLTFNTDSALHALHVITSATFKLGDKDRVEMPKSIEGLAITIGNSVYRLGIGGLHSSETTRVVRSTDTHVLIDADVASYYPSLILNSGKWPKALGKQFLAEFFAIKDERLNFKKLQKSIELSGKKNSPEWLAAMVGNEGGKIMINGTFGKTGSPYSVLFAPEMMIQTTITGQLALLMLVEQLEKSGIPVVSANTDGIVMHCPREEVKWSESLIRNWQMDTGLEMETGTYEAIYSRDINNYFAVKAGGEVKRKGEYSTAGLVAKKNPDVEICGDAVAEFLSKGTPLADTIMTCRDIRKFVVVQKVAGGGVKLWGEGPGLDIKVADIVPMLLDNGWVKEKRGWWRRGNDLFTSLDAHRACFSPQRPEYLGKVIRWYYATNSPGPIIYNTNGNTVGMSYGAKPCMTLPDELPGDIDYQWYVDKCNQILRDVGWTHE